MCRLFTIFLGLVFAFGSSPAVQLSLPDSTVAAGDTFYLPVITGDVSGLGVLAYEITVGFQPGILTPVWASSENTISSGWGAPVVNTNLTDRIIVVATGTTPLEGEGSLVRLQLGASGSPGSVTALDFLHAIYNEGTPPVEYDSPACSVWIEGNPVLHLHDTLTPIQEIQIYPNPANSGITLLSSHPLRAFDRFDVFNISGRRVYTAGSESMQSGQAQVTVDTSELPSGYYFVSMWMRKRNVVRPVVILK
ncbi:hypothetical protein AMJ86_03030 [bacterium SM23_57]|nr:MAG: hypothetical protein AMJ86_03030 [bacterium SM23_57]